ncbi:MAG: hypothetical protein ACHQ50_12880 [Fimbriimonadales bacterium]
MPKATNSIRRLWPVLFLALLPVIPLWRCVFLGEAIGPFDQIRQMAPWNGPQPSQPWDVLQADAVLQFYPWRDMVFKAWGHGQLPLWNPYELAGTPLLANSQSAGFYPPHVLVGLLHLPTAPAMTLLAWFHLFWAGLGTYLLARRFGASKEGAAIAGASFELSAFMLAWTGLPSVISTVAWIPWLLVGIKGIFELHPLRALPLATDAAGTTEWPDTGEVEKTADEMAARSRMAWATYMRTVLLTAFAAGMMLLAGHLQFAAYGLMSGALLAAWLAAEGWIECRREVQGLKVIKLRADTHEQLGETEGRIPPAFKYWWRSLATCVFALALGGALAAPQLLPVLNYAQHSPRRGAATESGYGDYAASAIQPIELLSIGYPKLAGDPGAWIPDIDSSTRLSAYWPQYVKRGANFAESAVSIGPVVLLLLCVLAWRRSLWRQAGPLALVGLAGILLAMGTLLTRVTYFAIPGWSSTGSPGRAIVLFILAACVMGGLAVAEPPGADGNSKLRRLVPVGVFLFISLLGVTIVNGALSTLWSPVMNQSMGPLIQLAVRDPLKIAMVFALLTAAAGGWWLIKGGRAVWAIIGLAALSPILVDGVLRFGDPSGLQAVSAGDKRVAIVNSNWGLVVSAPALLPPNTGSLSGIHELAGYDSLLDRDTKSLLDDINGKNSAPPANGNMMFIKPGADPAKLAAAGVTELWTVTGGPSLEDWMYLSARGGDIAKTPIDGPGRASTPQGKAEIVEETFSKLVVRANGPGRLVVRDRNMAGWLAKVDGWHVALLGSLWREVDLPAGEHTVEFNYVPPGMMTGIYLGFPAWVLLVGLGLLSLRSGRQ